MKRSKLVEKLINEGMSEKTLANLTDSQLSQLAERMIVKASDLTDPNVKKAVDTSTTPVQVVKEKEEETTEELKGNQKS